MDSLHTVTYLVRRALASRDEEQARDAAQLLENLNAAPDDEAFRSLLQDSFVASYMDDAMGAIQQGTGETSRRKKAGRPNRKLPDLPWPVPKPSRMDVIHKELFGKEAKTLGDVYAGLDKALRGVGFTETGIFAAPSGFTVVTPVERVHSEDMTSYTEPDRWTSGKLPLAEPNLSDYLRSLFLDHPGQFRLFIFLVTDKDPELSEKELTEKDARDLAMRGGKVLPDSIAAASFTDLQCCVLLYHFERKVGGEAAELTPSPFPIRTHLLKAGLNQFVE